MVPSPLLIDPLDLGGDALDGGVAVEFPASRPNQGSNATSTDDVLHAMNWDLELGRNVP